MPKEVKTVEEFLEAAKRASECRVKKSYVYVKTENGVEKRPILKVKARTRRYLYTLKFEDYEKGLEFAKQLKDMVAKGEVCGGNLVVLDKDVEQQLS
ncbi:50S ribosomal protein L38E [Pyrolobus fumarii 1A]|uniref:50S ribosomal protein L38E n=1 Tax=Pyrolobus fumarii (strain DSM 11204 / 1A) TaxID=694429 RepID=G0EH88_PYRF1|nr:50S ribosomal protein L38e [Pyrolobus fumarii]AEM39312.1 50S ribosomal protein L38E [Pyrolobus fumarii 1A]